MGISFRDVLRLKTSISGYFSVVMSNTMSDMRRTHSLKGILSVLFLLDVYYTHVEVLIRTYNRYGSKLLVDLLLLFGRPKYLITVLIGVYQLPIAHSNEDARRIIMEL